MNKLSTITAALATAGSLQASSLDPAEFGDQIPGSSWKQVMKEFQRLDANADGRLSREERSVFYISDVAQESLPLKWMTGVNLVWEDRVVSRAEFWRLLATLRSLQSGQQAAARRSWLASRKAERGL